MVETAVIVPTYNEADNLNDLVSQLCWLLPVSLGVIVVDDNSPDGTGDLADEWAAQEPERVLVVHRPGKMGLGTAYIAGFQKGLALGIERIMTMDADFSHHPCYIPAMIELSEQKHVVIGSRYVAGGGSRNCSWKRIVLSKGANLAARMLLGLKARDATAGFRLYRREVLASIPLERIFSSGYSFLVEMLFMCQRRGWQVGEVPIVFEDRRKGQTKISRQEVFKAQYTVFRLFARRLRGGEPRRPSVPISSS